MNERNMDAQGVFWRWGIEPHPYDSQYDTMITNSDEQAREAVMHAAELYLWDGNEGGERTLKVTLDATIPTSDAPIKREVTP